ncbi:MAG: hypothetical protein MZV49_16100 [Rhodopseudomonas palustris]|nr:hypothetical protein [Rhodopseudomonas palustris]
MLALICRQRCRSPRSRLGDAELLARLSATAASCCARAPRGLRPMLEPSRSSCSTS